MEELEVLKRLAILIAEKKEDSEEFKLLFDKIPKEHLTQEYITREFSIPFPKEFQNPL